jgi:N-formylglutamate deformylase
VDVHLLWQDATTLGASLVQARFPRTSIDVNRAADEIDAELLSAPWPGPLRETPKVRLGKGLVWRMLDDGTPIYDRRLTPDEVNQRIERCWVPYHRALDQAIEVAHRRHGHVPPELPLDAGGGAGPFHRAPVPAPRRLRAG